MSNIRLVKTILEEQIPSNDFSWFQAMKICRKNNLKNYYIGDRYKVYQKDQKENIDNFFSAFRFKYRTTLLRHQEEDIYYYDVLDNNTRYQLLEGGETATNVCTNVRPLIEEIRKKQKVKER